MAQATPPSHHSSYPKKWFYRHGWFLLLLGCVGLLYLHSIEQKKNLYRESLQQLQQLEQQKALALAAREELMLQIQSQSDPAWVEMILKRNLGMIREGQVKVYFSQ